jgi:hypothetical protein
MPQRFLRPGIRVSERWNGVSFRAQSLFVRILTLVDDFGRYEGRISVIWGDCFAVWNEQNPAEHDVISPQDCAALCEQLASKGLVQFYDAEGRKCLQVAQWQEKARSKYSKYPPCPQSASNPPRLDSIAPPFARNPPPPSSSSSSSSSTSGEGEGKGFVSNPPRFDSKLQAKAPEKTSPPLSFEPVKRGLYPREYDALLRDAEGEIERVKADDKNWIRDLSPKVMELIEFLGSEVKPGNEARIAELTRDPANYVRSELKPGPRATVVAWRQRVDEIRRAMKGLKP